MGCVFSKPDTCPVNSQDKQHMAFSDGTTIEYDRATKTLNIDCVGSITIKAAGEITISKPDTFESIKGGLMPGVHREGDVTPVMTAGHRRTRPVIPAMFLPIAEKWSQGGSDHSAHLPGYPETHSGAYMGTHDVYVNSRDIQTCGDPVDCGDHAASCSGDVRVN